MSQSSAFVPFDRKGTAEPDRLTTRVVEHVGAAMHVASRQILGDFRSPTIATPRWVAMWVLKQLRPKISLVQIGRRFGRDHTSVLNGLRRLEAKFAAEPDLLELAEGIVAELKQATGGTAPPPRTGKITPIWSDADLIAAALAGKELAFCAAFAGLDHEAARCRLRDIITAAEKVL